MTQQRRGSQIDGLEAESASSWYRAPQRLLLGRTLLVLASILPSILIFGVTYWLYQACDEYIPFRVFKAATVSALIIAMFSLIYFFLELLGYPRLSMMWIGLLGWSLFVAQMLRLKFERK